MKHLRVIFMFVAALLVSQVTLADESSYADGPTLNKAVFLAKTDYEKFEFLRLHFGLAPRGTRGIIYSNVVVSAPFQMVDQEKSGVSFRIYSAAKKAVAAYVRRYNEDGSKLVASVLFEPEDRLSNKRENPWAILLSRATVSRAGKVQLNPVVMYSIERNSQGEVLVKIGSQFDSPLL